MKKAWRIFRIFILAAGGVFLASLLFVVIFGQTKPRISRADAVIILGAAINTPALYNRSLEGLRVYNSGEADLMILSGGRVSDQDISEAGYMKKVILKNSTTTPPLLLEEGSRTTYENLENTKALAPGVKSLVVVSDRFHLARAVLVARAAGFSPVYWSAPDPGYYPPHELAFYYFREAVALLAYAPRLLFGFAR
ncbi:MAG: YdcF family protein [Patescibacteria group bacterium]|nr:YdcF family protein [Patescibacteria group bacterium]